VVIAGAAGLARVALLPRSSVLVAERVPFIALRLDLQTEPSHSHNLGGISDCLPLPPSFLAGLANGHRCVLVIDQLDALSYASGAIRLCGRCFRNCCARPVAYPLMRVLLACRSFDADHDHRIKRLLPTNTAANASPRPLSLPAVRQAVAQAGLSADQLSAMTLNSSAIHRP